MHIYAWNFFALPVYTVCGENIYPHFLIKINQMNVDVYTFDLILIVVCSLIKFVQCSIFTAYDT